MKILCNGGGVLAYDVTDVTLRTIEMPAQYANGDQQADDHESLYLLAFVAVTIVALLLLLLRVHYYYLIIFIFPHFYLFCLLSADSLTVLTSSHLRAPSKTVKNAR